METILKREQEKLERFNHLEKLRLEKLIEEIKAHPLVAHLEVTFWDEAEEMIEDLNKEYDL